MIAAELSSGGSTDSVIDDGNVVGIGVAVDAEAEGAAGKPALVDAQVDDSSDAEGAGDDEVANGGTDIPGGGAATASGSSISSNGRSGNCSSKGETGTLVNPFGALGVADVPVADGAGIVELNPAAPVDADVDCGPSVVPLAAASRGVKTKSFDEVAAFDEPAAKPAAIELAAAAAGFPAGELVPAATPTTGLIAFFVPVVAASFAVALDDGAVREAAPVAPGTLEDGTAAPPIGTPTGLEDPAGICPARLTPA